MSSYYCCISQKPPSPEGLPSRPVKLSTDAIPVASWSTASHPSKPEDVAELWAVFEGDKSIVNNDGSKVITVKRSASTLLNVKSKLRKHLSRESALSKHRPRSTVGDSDEEIQRRKELRLIRDRRIQEELSSEGAYDDDAKSLSTVETENSPYRKPWPKIRSEDMNSLKPMAAEKLPPLLMRKSADGLYVRKPSPISTIQRRHSFAVLEIPDLLMRTTTNWPVGRSSSDLPIPPAPMLKPQRLPSIVDPATRRTSWRLSFASDQRATRLRALSYDHELPLSLAGSEARGSWASPLKWLRCQVSRAPPFATANIPERLNAPDGPSSQAGRSPKLDDYQSVDGNAELLAAPISLHDMRISQRLASRGLHSHSSSPQLSSWGSQTHYQGRLFNSEASRQDAPDQSRQHQSESNLGISKTKVSTSWGDLLRDSISSINASTKNGVNPVPESSKFSVFSLNTTDNGRVSFQSHDSQEIPAAFQALSVIATTVNAAEVKPLLGSLSSSSARQDRRYRKDNSILASETLSFREREVELAMINARFPSALEKSRQLSSVRSKFNEEFDEKQLRTPTAPREKPPLLTLLRLPRLAKLVSRSYDGASPFELQIPGRQGYGYSFSNRSHSTAGTVSPGARSPGTKMPRSPVRDTLQIQGDDTEGIWAQALKRIQEEYESQLISESFLMKKDINDGHGNFLAIRSVSGKLKGKERASMDSLKHTEADRLAMGVRDLELEREFRRKVRKVETERAKAEEWVDELEARERQAKAKTAAMGHELSALHARMPPESWARFPSHTREERTASAGLLDHVSPKDFAIKNEKDGVVEWMTSDRKHHHRHHEKEQHHSLPIRVSKQIRASLYKLRTTKNTATSDVIHGRKSSVSVGGKLEYPELEILAGEMAGEGLYEEVERETAERMRRNERAARMVVFGEDGINGEVDVEANIAVLEVDEMSEISIADPRYYDDCITLPLEEDDEIDKTRSNSSITVVPVGKKEKYRTWSSSDRAATASMDSMALRRSTLDFQMELEMIESLERDRAIRSAEEAWGESLA